MNKLLSVAQDRDEMGYVMLNTGVMSYQDANSNQSPVTAGTSTIKFVLPATAQALFIRPIGQTVTVQDTSDGSKGYCTAIANVWFSCICEPSAIIYVARAISCSVEFCVIS